MITFNSPIQFQGSEVNDLRARRWRIDCTKMSLTSQGDGPTYAGPGTIEQTNDGHLTFVLYDAEGAIMPAGITKHFGGLQGTMLTATDFSTLTAVDIRGREWKAANVDFGLDGSAQTPGVICRGRIRELRCFQERSQRLMASVTAFFPGAFEFPANEATTTTVEALGQKREGFSLNIWRIQTELGDLHLTESESGLDVDFQAADRALPPVFVDRLEGTLTFALARRVRWMFAQVLSGDHMELRVRSEVRPERPRIHAPIEDNAVEAFGDAGVMVTKYLAYAVKTDPTERDLLTTATERILRASGTVLDDEALALCVEVEGLLRECHRGLGVPLADAVDAANRAIELMKPLVASDELLGRIKSAIGALKGFSPRTALRQLRDQGVIDQEHVDAWETLRHRAAHGQGDDLEVKAKLKLCNTVHQLFLLLVFDAIGYEGRFSDRTVVGWPLRSAKRQESPARA